MIKSNNQISQILRTYL